MGNWDGISIAKGTLLPDVYILGFLNSDEEGKTEKESWVGILIERENELILKRSHWGYPMMVRKISFTSLIKLLAINRRIPQGIFSHISFTADIL